MNRRNLKAIVSGLTGALILSTGQRFLSKMNADVPRIGKTGSRAVKNLYQFINIKQPNQKIMARLSFVADTVINTFYYTLIARGKRPLLSGSILGLGAGSEMITAETPVEVRKKIYIQKAKHYLETLGLHLTGGLITLGIFKLFERKG